MKILLNGEPQSYDEASLPLETLLKQLDLLGRPVVVELNQEPVLPDAYARQRLVDGDQIEIVRIAAGG